MKRTPIFVTVRANGATQISGYPEGFPVDGDALHSRTTLKKRAEALIVSDPDLLTAARAWLGAPLHPSDEPLAPTQVATLVSRLYCGGAARFIAWTPSAAHEQKAA